MKQSEWNLHFERQEQLGISVSAYCRKNRLSAGSWYKYQKIWNEHRSKNNFKDIEVEEAVLKEPEFQVCFIDGFYSLKINALSKPDLRKIISSFL